jgi:hypothetical protein
MIASANQVTATQQFVSYIMFNEMLMRSALYTSSWLHTFQIDMVGNLVLITVLLFHAILHTHSDVINEDHVQ